MKHLTIGLTAHVDAGKTTLAQSLLFRAGEIRDLRKAQSLDSHPIEHSRGITIFAHQARFQVGDLAVDLMDTPGHTDFSAETERILQILDCAVLVISGTDGVQTHTRTIWSLLERYHIPVFIFVNKMDISQHTREEILLWLREKLSPNCVRFDGETAQRDEDAALATEALMNAYLEHGALSDSVLKEAVGAREIFPVCFGSARTFDGVDRLLQLIQTFSEPFRAGEAFGANVFKISLDNKGNRLTFLKVTGGVLRCRDELRYTGADREEHREKITGIRVYTGAKYVSFDEAEAGSVCAVTGLSEAYAGLALGDASPNETMFCAPLLRYEVLVPEGKDLASALRELQELEREDPQLHVTWNRGARKIYAQLMGQVQLEVLSSRISERFGWEAAFDSGTVTYRETICETVEGVGHYEPLRHYAEVHLILMPLPRGSGLQFETQCAEDTLDRNWQRLILSHLKEKEHLGVLTGSPLTDIKFILASGKAHLKHTEGGDFRQATFRAVRQGLRSAQSRLLEPYYDFEMELPAEALGRAMTDIEQRAGSFSPPRVQGETARLEGRVPVAEFRDYASEFARYTHGNGTLSLTNGGFHTCHNEREVIEKLGYDPDADTENPADSVFCVHGAGHLVPWDEVSQHMHLPAALTNRTEFADEETPAAHAQPFAASDEELMAIYERTYGKINRNPRNSMRRDRAEEAQAETSAETARGRVFLPPDYLLVDGYNIIFAWDSLAKLARENLEAARTRLLEMMCNYQGCRACQVVVVFDAYRVKNGKSKTEDYGGIQVVYTAESETADTYIERTAKQLCEQHRVRVATSDGLEQRIVLGNGAARVSARELALEMRAVNEEIRAFLG